jgi:hypothetical protein
MPNNADHYFLSASNPIATVDQRDIEAMALEIYHRPVLTAARAQVTQRWKMLVGKEFSDEAWSRFDSLLDEWMFHYALMAVNGDSNYPRVLGNLWGAPCHWFGKENPGSRSGIGDNVDSNMTIIPVDANASFEVHGKRSDNPTVDIPIVLSGNVSLSATLGSIDWKDMQVEQDGTFVITLSPEPANGKPNHIQLKPEARYLFIRDCKNDWEQRPNTYRVKRLDPPTADPLTLEQIEQRAALFAVDDVPIAFFVLRSMSAFGVNNFSPAINSGNVGGMATQSLAMALLKIEDDEAYVVTIDAADACFHNIILHDEWLRSFDYWNTTSSMNKSQGAMSADGSTTYVITARDPGVHNWLDTNGFHNVRVLHRWQGLSPDLPPEKAPKVTGKLVKFKELERHLPADIKRIGREERKQQIAERQRTFALRSVDC